MMDFYFLLFLQCEFLQLEQYIDSCCLVVRKDPVFKTPLHGHLAILFLLVKCLVKLEERVSCRRSGELLAGLGELCLGCHDTYMMHWLFILIKSIFTRIPTMKNRCKEYKLNTMHRNDTYSCRDNAEHCT